MVVVGVLVEGTQDVQGTHHRWRVRSISRVGPTGGREKWVRGEVWSGGRESIFIKPHTKRPVGNAAPAGKVPSA